MKKQKTTHISIFDAATNEQKTILSITRYRLADKVRKLIEKEFGIKMDNEYTCRIAGILLAGAGVSERILTSDYEPKMTVSPEYIGECIMLERKEKNLTRKQISTQIGCTVNDIKQIEAGNLEIASPEQLEKLGQLFPQYAEMIETGRA